eukprot:COSAG03_NODE_40_length_17307_cov_3.149457_4_plen_81_part_00
MATAANELPGAVDPYPVDMRGRTPKDLNRLGEPLGSTSSGQSVSTCVCHSSQRVTRLIESDRLEQVPWRSQISPARSTLS